MPSLKALIALAYLCGVITGWIAAVIAISAWIA